MTETEKHAPDNPYLRGLLAGIRRHAHWDGGLQYVGTCGTTLQKALEEACKETVGTPLIYPPCNSHDALLEAVERIVNRANSGDEHDHYSETFDGDFQYASSVIALAKKGKP